MVAVHCGSPGFRCCHGGEPDLRSATMDVRHSSAELRCAVRLGRRGIRQGGLCGRGLDGAAIGGEQKRKDEEALAMGDDDKKW